MFLFTTGHRGTSRFRSVSRCGFVLALLLASLLLPSVAAEAKKKHERENKEHAAANAAPHAGAKATQHAVVAMHKSSKHPGKVTGKHASITRVGLKRYVVRIHLVKYHRLLHLGRWHRPHWAPRIVGLPVVVPVVEAVIVAPQPYRMLVIP